MGQADFNSRALGASVVTLMVAGVAAAMFFGVSRRVTSGPENLSGRVTTPAVGRTTRACTGREALASAGLTWTGLGVLVAAGLAGTGLGVLVAAGLTGTGLGVLVPAGLAGTG